MNKVKCLKCGERMEVVYRALKTISYKCPKCRYQVIRGVGQ